MLLSRITSYNVCYTKLLRDIVEREAIFKVHTRTLKMSPDVEVEFMAKQTPGFSGADIANVCNEAALIAARSDKKHIERQDFLDAVDRIIGGLERKSKIISQLEKKTIAFHEAGHATRITSYNVCYTKLLRLWSLLF